MKRTADKSLPLCKRSLFRIAAETCLRRLILVSATSALIFGAMLLAGRINVAEALISLLVVAAVFSAIHAPTVEMLLSLRSNLRQIPDSDAAFRGKNLRFVDGSWRYSDDLLLVDVSENSACLLYAPQINFSMKMRLEIRTWTAIHAHGYARQLLFRDLSGKIRNVRVIPCEQLRTWIMSHGGVL